MLFIQESEEMIFEISKTFLSLRKNFYDFSFCFFNSKSLHFFFKKRKDLRSHQIISQNSQKYLIAKEYWEGSQELSFVKKIF